MDYEAIIIELENAYIDTEKKVGSWQKNILLLILRTLLTICTDLKNR